MPAKTQNIEDMLNISENLYEAAMVIAKRARQINDELYQKKRDRQILEELEGGMEEEFMPAETEETATEEAPDEDENPILNSQREFLSRKIEYYYESSRR
ncbi:MAG: hypothetical protein GWN16_09580 [Calditrichae bacterium]|nr:hypothetical protein [Calditrichia bacterium]NIW79683.1 hypothetical protein [Calditrichia bacterium]